MRQIIISGYYGFDNAGDEAVLQSVIDSLDRHAEGFSPVVLSANPEKTSQLYNVSAVSRTNLKSIYHTISRSAGLISGGGSLLQDVTGPKTIPYYLSIIKMAQFLGKPTFIYAQGVGPVRRKIFHPLIRNIYNQAEYLSVRDLQSKKFLEEIGVKQEIDCLVDPVLALVACSEQRVWEILEKEDITLRQKPIFISIRPWKNDSFLPVIAQTADWLIDQGQQVIFLPMHYPLDLEISLKVLEIMENRGQCLKGQYSPKELLGITGCGKLMIGMRLHSLIFGANQNIPLSAISYDPKIDRFMESLNLGTVGTTENLSIDKIKEELVFILNELDRPSSVYLDGLNQEINKIKELAQVPAVKIGGILQQKTRPDR